MSFSELKKYRREVYIITDENVADLWLGEISDNLNVCRKGVFVLRTGDSNKNFENLEKILYTMFSKGFSREMTVIALGGGAVMDIAGFAASIYKHGIRELIFIPTTLLACVDAAFGGKNGINLKEGKNLVGTFREADKVIINEKFLATLSEREIKSGMAEVLKYGLIRDKRLLEKDICVADMISMSVDNKRYFVNADFKDKGNRKILNFGHTFAHAIEKMYGYKYISHGEAVGFGMILACTVGEKLGITEPELANKVSEMLLERGLPAYIEFKPDKLIEAIKADKKSTGDGVELILLREIGLPEIVEVDYIKLEKTLWEVHGEIT